MNLDSALRDTLELVQKGNKIIGDYSSENFSEEPNNEEKEESKIDIENPMPLVSKKSKAILILGKTGTGKTTMIYWLAKKGLIAKKRYGELVLEPAEQIDNIIVSHESQSETKIPNKIELQDDRLIWDCPGFGDTGGIVQEIANAFYIQRLFETSSKLKFILAIDVTVLSQRDQLRPILNQIVRQFKNLSQLENSLSMVVTHVQSGRTKQDIIDSLSRFLDPKSELNDDSRKVLKYAMKSLHLFYAPIEVGEYKEPSVLEEIDEETEYVVAQNGATNVVISENSMGLAHQLFDYSQAELLKLLKKVAEKIIERCKKINSPDNEFYQEQTLVRTIVGALRYFTPKKMEKKAFREQLQLDDIGVFETFCEHCSGKNETRQLLHYANMGIQKVIKRLILGLQDENAINELETLKKNIAESTEYVKFIELVCSDRKLNIQDIAGIIQECKKEIDEAAKKGAQNMNLDEEEDDPKYYEKAKKYIEKFLNDPKCKVIYRKADFHLGRIQLKLKNYAMAMNHFIDSLKEKDFECDKSYKGIDEIYFVDPKYLDSITNSRIFQELFTKNNEKFERENIKTVIDYLADFLSTRSKFLKFDKYPKHFQDVYYIQDLNRVRLILDSIIHRFNASTFAPELSNMLRIFHEDMNEKLTDAIDLLKGQCSYVLFLNHKPGNSQSLDSWKKGFTQLSQLINLQHSKTKELQVVENEADITYYNLIKELTSLSLTNSSNADPLNNNPNCNQNRAKALLEIGKIFKQDQKYSESMASLVDSYRLINNSNCIDILDQIYWLSHNVVAGDVEFQKLFEKNNNLFHQAVNGYLVAKLDNYLGNRDLFNKYKNEETHFQNICYISDLEELVKVYTSIHNGAISAKIASFENEIHSLFNIFGHDAKDEKKSNFEKEKKQILDYLKCLIYYYNKIPSNSNIKNQLIASFDAWKSLFNKEKVDQAFFTNIQSLTIIENIQEEAYFIKLNKYLGLFATQDPTCKVKKARSHYCLGKLYRHNQNLEEAIQNFKTAKELDNKLLDATSLRGEINFESKNYKEALSCYKEIDDMINARECFFELMSESPKDYKLREEFGDYYFEIFHMAEALSAYGEAISLTFDETNRKRIWKKMAECSNDQKAKDYFNKRANSC